MHSSLSTWIPRIHATSTTAPLRRILATRIPHASPAAQLHRIRFNSTLTFQGDIPLEKFLTKQLMDARKTRDTFKTNILRTVIGELQTEQKLLQSQKGTTPEKLEESALKSVRKAITKRKAAAEEYRSSNLAETAENEEREAAYLESILPKQLDEDQLRAAIESAYANIRSDESLFSTSTPPNPKKIVERISELVEATHGKGSFSSGSVYGIVMPMLSKDGVLKAKSK